MPPIRECKWDQLGHISYSEKSLILMFQLLKLAFIDMRCIEYIRNFH